MMTEMHRGEILGLQWDAVDLEAGMLTVRRNLTHYGDAYHLAEPKTKRSPRTLPLPAAPGEAALRTHRDRQRFERILAKRWLGDDWNLVFCRPDGHPLPSTVVTRVFREHLARAGLPPVRFHDLRQGAATYLVAAGGPMRRIMDWLGYSQMATTSDLYSHLLPEVRNDASEKIGAVLFGQRTAGASS